MCDKWVYAAITVTALATGPTPCHGCSPTLSGCTIHKQEGDQGMYCHVVVYYNINGSIRTCSSIIGAHSGSSYLVCCMAEIRGEMAAVRVHFKFSLWKASNDQLMERYESKVHPTLPTINVFCEIRATTAVVHLCTAVSSTSAMATQEVLAVQAHPTMPCMV